MSHYSIRTIFSPKKASAGIIAAFVILTFTVIIGVSSSVVYQSNVIQAKENLQEQQDKLIQTTQIKFNVTSTSYNESGEIVTAIIKNTGGVAIETNQLSYFVNKTYLTNITPTQVSDSSKEVLLLSPNRDMKITFSSKLSTDTVLPLEIIHDSSVSVLERLSLPYYIGEAGSFTVQNNENVIINFTQESYIQPPALFMTPKTANEGGGESPYAPIIHSINTTHANVSLCRDDGSITCDTTYTSERVSYVAFDVNRTNEFSWIEVGFITIPTDGSTSSISFSNTFMNTPYLYGQSQTYNINGVVSNGIAAHSWFPSASLTGAGIIGCDHPGTGDACAGTATEEFAYLAIDPVEQNIDSIQQGTKDISASTWTSITFTPSYTAPQILVSQNSDTGAQDPQYPWARLVSSIDAQIRYCEADAGGFCDGHSAETVRWMGVETGPIEVIGGPP